MVEIKNWKYIKNKKINFLLKVVFFIKIKVN